MSEEIIESTPVEIQEVESQEVELEGNQEEVETTEEPTSEKQDPWYKKRIDELTRDKHEARRQAERLEKMLEQQEQILRQYSPAQEQQAPSLAPPDPSQFAGGQYDPRYMDAMMQYTRESAVMEAKQAVAQEYEQRARLQTQQAAQAKLETAEAAARVRYADYDSVIERITSDPILAQNQTIREAILGMENGPDIAYQLGRNLDIAYEISNMSPVQAGMRLAAIVRQDARTSSAPKPIRPINGTGGTVNSTKSYAEMSTSEYIAARNAEDKAKLVARLKR
jgi:hypothetical protein